MKPADREWIRAAIARHPLAVVVSLLASWTLAWVALWLGTFFAVVGLIFATIEGITGNPLGVAGGLLGGLGIGITAMVWFYTTVLVGGFLPNGAYSAPLAVLLGAVLALGITVGVMTAEPWVLRLRGYRRLSRRESAVVDPILDDLAHRMDLDYLPLLMISDEGRPGAWTHCRHIVLTTGMVNAGIPDASGLNRQRLTAVLAHELAHWHAGDGIGATAVWAAALPLMLAYSVAAWLTRGEGRPTINLSTRATDTGADAGVRPAAATARHPAGSTASRAAGEKGRPSVTRAGPLGPALALPAGGSEAAVAA